MNKDRIIDMVNYVIRESIEYRVIKEDDAKVFLDGEGLSMTAGRARQTFKKPMGVDDKTYNRFINYVTRIVSNYRKLYDMFISGAEMTIEDAEEITQEIRKKGYLEDYDKHVKLFVDAYNKIQNESDIGRVADLFPKPLGVGVELYSEFINFVQKYVTNSDMLSKIYSKSAPMSYEKAKNIIKQPDNMPRENYQDLIDEFIALYTEITKYDIGKTGAEIIRKAGKPSNVPDDVYQKVIEWAEENFPSRLTMAVIKDIVTEWAGEADDPSAVQPIIDSMESLVTKYNKGLRSDSDKAGKLADMRVAARSTKGSIGDTKQRGKHTPGSTHHPMGMGKKTTFGPREIRDVFPFDESIDRPSYNRFIDYVDSYAANIRGLSNEAKEHTKLSQSTIASFFRKPFKMGDEEWSEIVGDITNIYNDIYGHYEVKPSNVLRQLAEKYGPPSTALKSGLVAYGTKFKNFYDTRITNDEPMDYESANEALSEYMDDNKIRKYVKRYNENLSKMATVQLYVIGGSLYLYDKPDRSPKFDDKPDRSPDSANPWARHKTNSMIFKLEPKDYEDLGLPVPSILEKALSGLKSEPASYRGERGAVYNIGHQDIYDIFKELYKELSKQQGYALLRNRLKKSNRNTIEGVIKKYNYDPELSGEYDRPVITQMDPRTGSPKDAMEIICHNVESPELIKFGDKSIHKRKEIADGGFEIHEMEEIRGPYTAPRGLPATRIKFRIPDGSGKVGVSVIDKRGKTKIESEPRTFEYDSGVTGDLSIDTSNIGGYDYVVDVIEKNGEYLMKVRMKRGRSREEASETIVNTKIPPAGANILAMPKINDRRIRALALTKKGSKEKIGRRKYLNRDQVEEIFVELIKLNKKMEEPVIASDVMATMEEFSES